MRWIWSIDWPSLPSKRHGSPDSWLSWLAIRFSCVVSSSNVVRSSRSPLLPAYRVRIMEEERIEDTVSAV